MTGRRRKNPIRFYITLSEEQVEAKRQILTHPVNFIEGVAGTGKTILACQIGLDLLFDKKIDQIIITRPTVSTEDNGFLPGTFQEKMEPWMVPIRDNMRKVYSKKDKLEKLYEEGQIEMVSLTHFRGRTFSRSVCIIDEYQNLTQQQLAMAIGRLGKDSIMIFCGDAKQIDLKYANDSAVTLIDKLDKSQFVYRAELIENHRHPAVSDILNILYK